MTEKTAQKEPGKKPVPSKKPKPQQEVVVQIPLSELHPFPDHPFQVRKDASMQETAESVKEYGVLVPALARPREDGGYELIAGHRRKHACELAGLATMPVIVRDIDRDAATIIMVDSNLQRENILPSERAKAYKMKMEAIKRQGARTDLTSPKISAKFRSDDEVGQDAGVSGDTIRNYIALTQLVPELQQMVDEKKIALSPAYQIAALTPKEQSLLLETIDSEQATPSLSQAQRMKKLSQSGELNEDTMLSISVKRSATAGRFTFQGGVQHGNHAPDASPHRQRPHGGTGHQRHHRLHRKSAKDRRRQADNKLAVRQQDRRCRVPFRQKSIHPKDRQSARRG